MGLDMYLEKHTYVRNWDKDGNQTPVEIRVEGIKPERVTRVVEEVGYWRKANAIHAWFVRECAKGVDDCQPVYVREEKLEELRDVVKAVIAEPKKGQELLPTQDGFFFGGTAYDRGYVEDLEHTLKIVEGALKEGGEFYYRASW